MNAQFGCQFGLSILDLAVHSGCEFSVWLSIPAVICGACREPHCNWCCGCSGEEIFEESDYQQALDAHNKQVDALEVCRSPCLSHSASLTHSACGEQERHSRATVNRCVRKESPGGVLSAMHRSCEKSDHEAGAPLHQQLSLQVLVHVSVTQFGSYLICTLTLSIYAEHR